MTAVFVLARSTRGDDGFAAVRRVHALTTVAAAPGRAYWRSFVYVEAAGLPPSGTYAPNSEGSRSAIENFGSDYEPYGLVDDKPVVRPGEYDDGGAMTDGELRDIQGRPNLRIRPLTPDNSLFAEDGSSINSPALAQTF